MRKLISTVAALALSTALFAQGTAGKPKLAHQTDDKNAPVVYLVKDISAAGLMRAYHALGQKIEGKVGIKVSFGARGEDVLDPKLLADLAKATGGTLLDASGLSASRATAAQNYTLARENGFGAVAPLDMIDEDGDIDMPVTGGYFLKYARTGKHLDNYGTLVAIHRFKAHHLPIYGGNMKNLALNLSSVSGKAIIHSAGADERRFRQLDDDTTAKAFADAAKAAMDYKKGRWAFVNVLDSLNPADGCGAKNLGDIGILASLDPVAIDQAACDLVYGAAPDNATREKWETYHSTRMLDYAEKIGVGKRHYRLVVMD